MGNQTTRAALGCAMMFALCAEGVSDPASVHAYTHCMQWQFDGYTEFDYANGSKLWFVTYPPNFIPDSPFGLLGTVIPSGGGPAVHGQLTGPGILNGNVIFFWLTTDNPQAVANYWGGVRDDGFANGTFFDDGQHTSGSWRSAAPLRCADNGA